MRHVARAVKARVKRYDALVALKPRLARQVRMRRPATIRRRAALEEEVQFWRSWFATGGLQWAEEYRFKTTQNSEVNDPLLVEILGGIPQPTVSILDVGAGPITSIGFRYPGKQLAITAVDPLAGEYDWILHEYAIEPPVRTLPLRGEQLLERFARASFDVAFAQNSLDHTVDPLPVIRNMVAVVRPGGHVVLRHTRNEAVTEQYRQLHQWNFDERDGRCVVWRRPGRERDLAAELGIQVQCTRDLLMGYEWICCVISTPPD